MFARVAVGQQKTDYPGYRMVTLADVKNAANTAVMLSAHQAGNGWPLLQDELIESFLLHISEGVLLVDGAVLSDAGTRRMSDRTLTKRYQVQDFRRDRAWSTYPPGSGAWALLQLPAGEQLKAMSQLPPCLFVPVVRSLTREITCVLWVEFQSSFPFPSIVSPLRTVACACRLLFRRIFKL